LRLRIWCFSFAPLYLIGVIGTTAAVENGINNTIITATQPPPELPHMLSTWLPANHVCAPSAIAAFVVAWLGFPRLRLNHGRERITGNLKVERKQSSDRG
jgi:hypothetical protein